MDGVRTIRARRRLAGDRQRLLEAEPRPGRRLFDCAGAGQRSEEGTARAFTDRPNIQRLRGPRSAVRQCAKEAGLATCS